MKSTLIIVFSIIILFFFSTCTKEEGEGGTSTIRGKVYVINYNAEFTEINGEYYAQEEPVYIIYGDNEFQNDRFRTHYDGTYCFQYLRKGHYTVYAYSKDSTGNFPSGYFPVEIEAEITENHQNIELHDIVILK